MRTTKTGACPIDMKDERTEDDIFTEELVEVLLESQNELQYIFGALDIFNIMVHTIRKCELNGKDKEYVPILFKDELKSFVIEKKINEIWRKKKCVANVI